MYVSTDRDFFLISSRYVDQRLILLKDLLCCLDDHASILLMQDLSVFLVLHQLLAPLWCYFAYGFFEPWAIVGIFNYYIVDVDWNFSITVVQTWLELPEPVLLHRFFILLSSIFVVWLHLADLLEVLDSKIKLIQSKICRAQTIIGFKVRRIALDCIRGIKKRQRVILGFNTHLGPVAIIYSFLYRRNIAEDCLWICI